MNRIHDAIEALARSSLLRPLVDAVAVTSWGMTFRQAWVGMRDHRGTMSRRGFWVLASTLLGLFGATCVLLGAPLLLLPDKTSMPALVPIGLWAMYVFYVGLAVFFVVLLAAVQRVREATGSGSHAALGWLNPLLLIVLLASPRFDRRRNAALGDEYLDTWQKYADYRGVSTRREYFRFTGITAAIVVVSIVLSTLVAQASAAGTDGTSVAVPLAWGSFIAVVLLGAQVAWLPLALRRSRDAYGEEPDAGARIIAPMLLQMPGIGMPVYFVVWTLMCLRQSRNPTAGETAVLETRDAPPGLRRRRSTSGSGSDVDARRGASDAPGVSRRGAGDGVAPSHGSRYNPRFHQRSRRRSIGDRNDGGT